MGPYRPTKILVLHRKKILAYIQYHYILCGLLSVPSYANLLLNFDLDYPLMNFSVFSGRKNDISREPLKIKR